MARISLRVYQRDIEELVETHQFDQAIAHCRHILRFYPKDVNTYRLLGKAYLESQRYGDASDIFIRVLSTIPDDFVSHVGMSIIREDEGNLDEAIWHMLRAFETQPANGAIQAELRRLHGRREGIEPPKIRLTRGALARMYIKGELYAQALTELRTELHEDPKRADLLIVLAQAYYLSGQRVDAAEACSTLLRFLPFCLEANKILADILSHSERAAEAQVYLKRVQSLDPYTTHISSAAPTSEKVPDSAVLLEKLEWRPGMHAADMAQQPEWATSLGVDLDTVTGPDSVPDWLAVGETRETRGESETSIPPEQDLLQSEVQTPASSDAVPDWMKDAGWTASQETDEQPDFLPLTETEGIEADLAPANIPDWLKTMAPSETNEAMPPIPISEPVSAPTEEESHVDVLPWLEETPPVPTDSVAMWLEKQEPAASLDDELDLGTTAVGSIPDWLQDLGEPVQAEKSAEDELSQAFESEEMLPAGLGEDDISHPGVIAAVATAAGLIAADQKSEEPREELQQKPETAAPSLEEPLAEAELSEWLQSLEPLSDESQTVPKDQQEIFATTEPDYEEQPEQALAAAGMEASPGDWFTEIEEPEETQLPTIGVGESSSPLEAQPLEDNEAFAWLENLAARQGADEALLLTPDERRETPPEWILAEAEEELTQEPQADHVVEAAGAVLIASAISEMTGDDMEEEKPIEITGFSVEEPELPLVEEEFPLSETETTPEFDLVDLETVESETGELTEPAAVAAASVSAEPVGADEMLFFPQEAAKLGEMPLSLDEPPITEEDTKPKAVKIEAMGAVAAVSVAAGAIAAATGKEDEATPAVLEDAIASEPEITEEQPALVETSELGEEVTSAPGEPTGELAGESAKPIAEGVVIPEEDDAFAWLESLAARQGAEEALLLAPEERQETPPEWVIQEAAEAEAALPDETLGESELPDWLQAGPEATPEAEPAGGADASVPDWLDQPAAITEETIEAEGSTPLAPELPTWLAGIEDAQKGTEPAGWEPSDESFEVGETLETIPEIAPESLLQATPEPALDLNQAGLVDLERLPGVGFIKAQAILDYRQQHGSFQEVDELLLVAGITPEILLDLKHYLRVGGVEAIASFELPVEDQEILLVQARNALVQGDISLAISRYALLIEKKQMLPEVINDLNEALYRFPIDISIWEALGDAHMHSGHLQDALNAYTKAEEYLHE